MKMHKHVSVALVALVRRKLRPQTMGKSYPFLEYLQSDNIMNIEQFCCRCFFLWKKIRFCCKCGFIILLLQSKLYLPCQNSAIYLLFQLFDDFFEIVLNPLKLPEGAEPKAQDVMLLPSSSAPPIQWPPSRLQLSLV